MKFRWRLFIAMVCRGGRSGRGPPCVGGPGAVEGPGAEQEDALEDGDDDELAQSRVICGDLAAAPRELAVTTVSTAVAM